MLDTALLVSITQQMMSNNTVDGLMRTIYLS